MIVAGDRGHRVYFAQCDFGGPIKIGHSLNREGRVAALGADLPFRLVEVGSCPGAVFREKFLHCWFRQQRIRGEWFAPTPELWRWALQARTTGQIIELPDEPCRSAGMCTRSIRWWISGRVGRFERIVKAMGVTPTYVQNLLKRDVVEHVTLQAAFAVSVIKEGLHFDWHNVEWEVGTTMRLRADYLETRGKPALRVVASK